MGNVLANHPPPPGGGGYGLSLTNDQIMTLSLTNRPKSCPIGRRTVFYQSAFCESTLQLLFNLNHDGLWYIVTQRVSLRRPGYGTVGAAVFGTESLLSGFNSTTDLQNACGNGENGKKSSYGTSKYDIVKGPLGGSSERSPDSTSEFPQVARNTKKNLKIIMFKLILPNPKLFRVSRTQAVF